MRAIHNNATSVPFNCYFSGSVRELQKFISQDVFYEDIYEHEPVK